MYSVKELADLSRFLIYSYPLMVEERLVAILKIVPDSTDEIDGHRSDGWIAAQGDAFKIAELSNNNLVQMAFRKRFLCFRHLVHYSLSAPAIMPKLLFTRSKR